MAVSSFNNLNTPEYPIKNAMIPAEGPKAIPTKLTFGGAITTYAVDFGQNVALRQISFIQGAYVDNSANSSSVTIVCNMTNQIVTIPALSQQYVPLLAGDPPQFTVTSNGTAAVPIYWLNVPLPADHWGSTGSVTVAGLNFDGSGNLKTADQNLLALISAGGLNVNVISSVASGSSNYLGARATVTVGQTIFTPTAGQKFVLNNLSVIMQANTFKATPGFVTINVDDESSLTIWSADVWVPGVVPIQAPMYAPLVNYQGMNYKSLVTNNRLRGTTSAALSGGGFSVNATIRSEV